MDSNLLGRVEWCRVGGDPALVLTDGESIRFYDTEAALLRHFRTLGFNPEIYWPKRVFCICRSCDRVGSLYNVSYPESSGPQRN